MRIGHYLNMMAVMRFTIVIIVLATSVNAFHSAKNRKKFKTILPIE